MADRRSLMETVQEGEEQGGEQGVEGLKEGVGGEEGGGETKKEKATTTTNGHLIGFEALGLDTSLLNDGHHHRHSYNEQRKQKIADQGSVLVSWTRNQMKQCLRNDATTQVSGDSV